MMKRLGIVIAGVLLMLTLSACWGSKEPKSTIVSEETNGLSLNSIFGTQTFEKPVGLERRADYKDLIYIIEQPGRIVSMSLKHPSNKPTLVLDITDRVYDEGGEQGLLGLAFHPKHPNQAYVNYTTQNHTVIARYDTDPNQRERLDPSSEQILLTFEQPYANHNGGQLAFGPDGYLYIATGDGGSGGDPHNNGQNLNTLLGKILRNTYGRDQGVSITGGFVYRGQQLPELVGWYVYADYGTGTLWALRQHEDGTIEHQTLLQSDANITSFGRDADDELYICTQEGKILKII
jgi:glucose/arabinose dehydrogenase